MDYRAFVQKHRDSGAAITIAALPCAEKEASSLGVMKIDASGQVTEFAEKPKGDALKAMRVDTTCIGVDEATAKEKPYIASMGIYGASLHPLRTRQNAAPPPSRAPRPRSRASNAPAPQNPPKKKQS
jgi:glucose-1-phosphate adenylyltransferase